METRVNARIDYEKSATNTRFDDAKAAANTRFDDAKAATNARIDFTNTRIDDVKAATNVRIDYEKAAANTRIDELKAEGMARDAKLNACMKALARIEADAESRRRARRELAPIWIGFAVAAAAIIAGVASRFFI